jgi:hypothetical protein
MPSSTPPRVRIRRGSIASRYLLSLPADLDEAARADARRLRLSLAEWWRRAGAAFLRAAREAP